MGAARLTVPAGRLAPLSKRLFSSCYEALFLAALLWAAGALFELVELASDAAHTRVVFQAYLTAVVGVYFASQWTRGQTLAMKTWGLHLVTRLGARVRFTQALVRYLCALAGVLLFGVTFWWALVDRERQFLHDRLADTRLVICEQSVPSASARQDRRTNRETENRIVRW